MGKIFCPYCGEELNDNENFCHFCGEKVSVYIDDVEEEDIKKLAGEIKEIENEILLKSKNEVNNKLNNEKTPIKSNSIDKLKNEKLSIKNSNANNFKSEKLSTNNVDDFKNEKVAIKNDNINNFENVIEKTINNELNTNKNEFINNEKVLKNEKVLVKNGKADDFLTTKNMISLLLIVVLFSGGMVTQNLFGVKKEKPLSDLIEENDTVEKNITSNENVTKVSEGYFIVFDENEKAYFIVGVDGSVKKKIENVKNGKIQEFRDGYAVIDDNIYNDKFEKVLDINNYKELNYVGDGLVVFVDTSSMKGIYDLNNKKYALEPSESLKSLEYLDEKMFLITMNDNKYIYNLDTNNMYDATEFSQKLVGVYKDGYIVFKDSDAVYLVDKNASKKLIATVSSNDKVGQYRDGLLFVNNSFYDKNGNKMLDLRNEKITNTPVFVNGYSLIIIDEKYFTVIEKETGKYLFEVKAFEYIDDENKSIKTIGLYKGEDILSKSGFLLVKLNDEKDYFALMDKTGEIKVRIPRSSKIKSTLSVDDYISYLYNDELYIISTDGKNVKISLTNDTINENDINGFDSLEQLEEAKKGLDNNN